MLVVRPLAQVDGIVIDVFERGGRELGTFCYKFATEEILHTLRGLARSEGHELAHEHVAQRCLLFLVFLVKDGKHGIGALALFLFGGAAEQIRSDNDTFERRRCFERCVLHVACLVAENSTEQLLLGSGIALTLRSDFTYHDVAGYYTGTHADYTALVKVLGGIFADIGNVAGEFLHTALGLPHFEGIFVDVHARKNVVANHTLVEHDSILIVVALPWHERHFQVAAESKFATFGGITLGEDVALLDTLSGIADGTQVDGGALVGLAELGYVVLFDGIVESHKLLVLRTVVTNADDTGVYILDYACTFSGDLRTAVADELSFNTSADYGSLAAHQGHCLAHHVRSHERAVCVVVLEEGDE